MSAPRPPQIPGHWLVGNVREFRGERLQFFERLQREHGDVASFRLGYHHLTLLSHPDALEQVLVTENRKFQKHYVLQLLRCVLGNGLLLSEGDYWLRQRRLIQPFFSRAQVNGHAETMIETTRRCVSGWTDGAKLDLHTQMMRLALAIAAKVLLDVDSPAEFEEISGIMDLLMVDFDYRFESVASWPRWVPTPWNRKVAKDIARLSEILLTIVEERRRDAAERSDLLSKLIQARDADDGRGMDDRQLRDEVITLMLAGHETSANALAWTWHLLMQHPEVEQKLLDEHRRVLGDREPTAADLPQLKFTEQVLTESMRLYPPVFVFGRMARTTTEIGGYEIPAGSTLLMSQWILHRDPRWFEEPERFDPHRWEADLAERIPKFAYCPFGGGPRVCVGNTFAMVEMVAALAVIVRRFRFEATGAVEPWASVTLRPRDGVPVVVHERSTVAAGGQS